MLLFEPQTVLAYLVSAVALVLMPGPGTAWIAVNAAAGGMRRGVRAGLGLETATLLHALAAGLGLSALLAASALAFETIKYCGAAYLIWLGIKAWRGGSVAQDAAGAAPAPMRGLWMRSVMTGLLNPKVALFFVAFLPQFVHPERGMVWLQFLVLGALLALVGFANDVALSFLVGRFGRRLRGGGRWRHRLTGTVFVALGLRLAAQQRG
ncbi:LysE family translocator [Luteimonas aquatica]|uniref:LysE family translocator n=1 Tax=Luteimonas aquatica TaxID=450364 RepID=UPI001F5A3EC7|nr:LysE family translocator [Luteimonas aquatica]